MWRVGWLCVGAISVNACSNTSIPNDEGGGAVAGRVVSPAFVVAFTGPEHSSALGPLLGGQSPEGYRWVRLKVEGEAASQLGGDGLSVDLSDPRNAITFSQSYPEKCNPIKDDYSDCWFVETYAAGIPGLKGHLSLRVDATTAAADIDITWEGYTDRYGNGTDYYYKHGTLTGFSAPIVQTVATGGPL